MTEDEQRLAIEEAAKIIAGYDEFLGFSVDEARAILAPMFAKIAVLEAENAALRKYASEATKAITGLVGGGSEMFAGQIGSMFKADLPFCVERMRSRLSNAHEAVIKAVTARKDLAAENAALRQRLVVDDAMVKRAEIAYANEFHRTIRRESSSYRCMRAALTAALANKDDPA